PLGVNFKNFLVDQIALSSIMLVLIGPDWLSMKDERGHRRIDNVNDFVRIEIEAAFQHGIPVVPLFIDQTSFPKPEELPESLRTLAIRNGVVLRLDANYLHDLSRLITQLRGFIQLPEAVTRPQDIPGEEAELEIHPDIFISYASDDRLIAEDQALDLEKRGYTVWWDKQLVGGQKYQKVI